MNSTHVRTTLTSIDLHVGPVLVGHWVAALH